LFRNRDYILGKVVRKVYYFDEPGAQNTEDVMKSVVGYLKENKMEYLIIASTSGKTALRFTEALRGEKIKVICVSEPPSRKIFGDQWPCIDPEIRRRLEAFRVMVVRVPYKFHDSVFELAKWHLPVPEHIVGDTLAFVGGQGLKVAVEAMFMAVQAGYVEPNKDVLAVAGYGGGADTAIVVKTCFPETLFSSDPQKRLEVREILAMARKKKWWKWDERSCL
jgi:hypothetical protein